MKDWYLLTPETRPNMLGGYEDESHLDFKEDAFLESLDTDIGSTVVLYNYDLSESKEIRCIIQENVANTMLKSMERIGLFPIGTVQAGMYIFFENRYWLITGYPGNNGIYEKATLVLCQYQLKWQNDTGEIIERWCNITSASKYDVGESGNKTIYLSSNNYTLLLPNDDLSMTLDGKRVFIDKMIDNPYKVFKITRNDDILYDYGENHGGILNFIADKVEFNKDTDNQELRLCDYISASIVEPPTEDTPLLTANIVYSGGKIIVGSTKKFIPEFKDLYGEIYTNVLPKWKVTLLEGQEKYISYYVKDDILYVETKYSESLFGQQILIELTESNNVASTSEYIKLGGAI